MILDNENQRAILLEILNKSQYPGSAIDLIYELKVALENAEIVAPNE